MTKGTQLFVFAYGSNLYSPRMRARVATAKPISSGYVACRQIAFHKRSQDGSAKADAVRTSVATDKIWGVVYQLKREEKPVLDRFEFLGIGYDEEQVSVVSQEGLLTAWMYVARQSAIDPMLSPYCWYLNYVVSGAREHCLPESYIDCLRRVETVVDPDPERRAENRRLIDGS